MLSKLQLIAPSMNMRLLVRGRWLLTCALLGLGIILILVNWHFPQGDADVQRQTRIGVIVGMVFLGLAVLAAGRRIRPRLLIFNPPAIQETAIARDLSLRPMWAFTGLGVVLMLVLVYWYNPELSRRVFPLSFSSDYHVLSSATLGGLTALGAALIIVASAPWLMVYFLRRGDSRWAAWLRLYPLAWVGVSLLTMTWFWADHTRGAQFLGAFDSPTANDRQVILFALALLFFVLGMMRPVDVTRIGQRLRGLWRTHRLECALVLALTIAAFTVRIYRLGTLLPIMISDEPFYLYVAREMMSRGRVQGIGENWSWGEVYLGAHLVSMALRVFGATLFGGRILAAIMGTLSIPGVYLMARRAIGWQAALLASLFLITQPVHFHFSRTMLNMPFDPVFGIFAMLLIWNGLERGGRWKFALAGVLVGLAQYFYVGAILWLVLIPAWLALIWMRKWRLAWAHRVNWAVLLAGFLFTMTPLLSYVQFSHVNLLHRQREMSQLDGQPVSSLLEMSPGEYIEDRLVPALFAYLDTSDRTYHFEPGAITALNLQFGFTVFALGVVYGLRFGFNPGMLFVVVWIGMTTFLGGSMMRDVPGFSRYFNAMLPAAILAGAGGWWMIQSAGRGLPRRWHSVLIVPAVCIMLAVNVQDLRYMLTVHPQRTLVQFPEQRIQADALAQASIEADKDPHSIIFWLVNTDHPQYYNNRYDYTYIFYQGKFNVIVRHEPITEEWLSTRDNTQNLYFFVSPQLADPASKYLPLSPDNPVWQIKAAFPAAQLYQYDSSGYQSERLIPLFSLVYVPANTGYCSPECRANRENP